MSIIIARERDWTIWRGLPWQTSVKVVSTAGPYVGSWTARSQLRASPSGPLVYEAACTWDEAAQIATVYVSDAATAALDLGALMYDVLLISPDGVPLPAPIAAGNITVKDVVTHD